MMTTIVASTIAVSAIGTKLFLETFSITCTKTVDMITHLITNQHPSLEEFNKYSQQKNLYE